MISFFFGKLSVDIDYCKKVRDLILYKMHDKILIKNFTSGRANFKAENSGLKNCYHVVLYVSILNKIYWFYNTAAINRLKVIAILSVTVPRKQLSPGSNLDSRIAFPTFFIIFQAPFVCRIVVP